MKKLMVLLMAVGLIFSFTGCPTDSDDNGNSNNNGGDGDDGIKWTPDANGTLTVINNTNKDMVIFVGQTAIPSNIWGGVRGLAQKTFDVSSKVDDFGVGGFVVLRGITLAEYNATKNNPSLAKVEYQAMATYGQGKQFRTEINPSFMGDYGYRVSNTGRLGIELRKDSPDGEKVGYLPALATNSMLYADTTAGFTVYPVYVYLQKSSGAVTTLKPTSLFDTVSVSPRDISGNQIQTYLFPADSATTWDQIVAQLVSPNAYVTITNNVPNQSARVTIAGSNRINSQNGFDSIGSGETLTYEVTSTATGSGINLTLQYYGGALNIPVRFAGETGNPTLKNGYDYTVTVSGAGQTAEGYTVTLTESATARDLSSEIVSL